MKNTSKTTVKKLLGLPVSPYEIFHNATSTSAASEKAVKGKKLPEALTTVFFKGYVRFESIQLPKPGLLPPVTLGETLKKRRSRRNFTGRDCSLKELSALLQWSAGFSRKSADNKANRHYPSAGARYPLEVYVIPLHLKELPPFVMHYYLKDNSLERLFSLGKFDAENYFMRGHGWIQRASFLIIITAVFERTTLKYGDRGYRHVQLEAGHLAQNISLAATALSLKSCCVSGFNDKELNGLLDIDGVKEAVIYSCAIGK